MLVDIVRGTFYVPQEKKDKLLNAMRGVEGYSACIHVSGCRGFGDSNVASQIVVARTVCVGDMVSAFCCRLLGNSLS
jgi:hypothetical protein